MTPAEDDAAWIAAAIAYNNHANATHKDGGSS